MNLKRYEYSLRRTLERYPDGAPSHVIAAALMMTEEELEAMYGELVIKLRTCMGVKE